MGGLPPPDGAVIRFKVVSVEGISVTIQVEGNKAAYFEVGQNYEATVKEKK